jgi:hypothetical protein
MEKKYDFFIDDKKITDGILSFKIISKRNDKDFPWKCTYFGAPLSYKIDKTEADGSAEVNVELLDYAKGKNIPVLGYQEDFADAYEAFYESLFPDEV